MAGNVGLALLVIRKQQSAGTTAVFEIWNKKPSTTGFEDVRTNSTDVGNALQHEEGGRSLHNQSIKGITHDTRVCSFSSLHITTVENDAVTRVW